MRNTMYSYKDISSNVSYVAIRLGDVTYSYAMVRLNSTYSGAGGRIATCSDAVGRHAAYSAKDITGCAIVCSSTVRLTSIGARVAEYRHYYLNKTTIR